VFAELSAGQEHAHREVVVRPFGNDAAIIRYRAQSAATFEGVAFDEDHRCLMVCVRQSADWQIVMEQYSQNGD